MQHGNAFGELLWQDHAEENRASKVASESAEQGVVKAMTLVDSLQQERAAEPSVTLRQTHQSQNRQVQLGRLRNVC